MKKIKCDKCGNLMQVKCAVRPKTAFKNCRLVDVTIGCKIICEKCKKEHVINFKFRKE